jgi:adenine-specific DNA methylase
MGDIQKLKLPKSDIVYLDPPYTHGVLYSACYHLNDSIAQWTKPELDDTYAIPRPKEVCFRKNKQTAGGFYNQGTAVEAFDKLIKSSDCARLVLSYSDAPRNTLTIDELYSICNKYGSVELYSKEHKICTQPNSLKKVSETLKEFFIVLDKQ